MVQTFFKGLILIHNCDVADVVDLMESLDAVLNELSQLDGCLHGIGYALNDNVV